MNGVALLLTALLLVAAPSCGAGTVQSTSALSQPDWQRFYGDQPLHFIVMRKGKAIGSYTTRFVDEPAGGYRVEARLAIEVRVLLWDYRYQYQAEEVWQPSHNGEVLSQLQVEINDDGKPFSLSLQRQGKQLVGSSSQGNVTVPLPVLTTQHYNAAVLQQSQVLNTLTGKVNSFHIVALGEEMITAQGRQIAARHYRYQGELHDTDVWYDAAGRWLRLRFRGKDGTPIELVCQQCGLPDSYQQAGSG
ncbi:DUF6134 family protein [Pokkaliibacter sp. MBI-7]|uniref:DUF6134 family protein n=1 Tax=Pokkaliibacter sp. MBI-7 TaxID=3040600 RepID=UPI0024484BF8|nr:DUF6134 family protein [Pokkaliibacter sp. MBI-7]MDH2433108.1 DUF6134 family protein [Pokkaliibacter sp. MBI-7]